MEERKYERENETKGEQWEEGRGELRDRERD